MADSSRLRGWKYDHHNNYLEVFVNGTQVAYFDDATNDLRLLTNGMTIDAGGMTITEGNVTLTDGDLSVTGTTTLIGEVTVTGGVTWTGASNVTLTAPTTADDAFYGQIVASAGWTAGNMVGIRGKVTLSGTANYVSATGGWFGLDFATKTGSGSGLTCGLNVEVGSNNTTSPNAIVYLQSLPTSTANFANVPFIAFTETATGTGSNILFSLGHTPAGTGSYVTTGTSGNIIYQQTLHIIANGSDAYIPYSTVAGAFTTAYLIQSSLATGSTTTGSGAVIIAGGVGVGGAINAGSYISVPQGSQVYLDGPGGAEYIRSATVGYLLANATTAVDLGIGGVTKMRVQTAEVEFQSGVYVDILGDLGVSLSLTVVGNCTFSGTDVGIAGTLTVITAINNGYDAAGGAMNLYADITGHGVFFDPTADTNQGSLSVGATGGSKGTDLYLYGTTSGSYALWDQSANYLVFAGAGRLEVGTFGTPISLDTFTGNEDIHGAMVSSVIDAAMTAGEVSRNIWSRMKITADQTANVSIYGACLQCRAHTGSQTVELSAGAYAGAWLYFEASDSDNIFTLSGGTLAAAMATVELSSAQLATTGSIYGIKINSAVHADVDVSGLTNFCAIYINGGTGKEDWTTGIVIEDCATAFNSSTVPIAAAVAATISVNDTCTATSGRGIGLFVDYIANGAHTSAYGVRSSRINTQILANVPSVIIGDWYIHDIDDVTINDLFGLSMYWEDYGNAVTQIAMIDLGKNSGSATVGNRNTFIRCREHTGITNNSSVLRMEGSSAAEYLLWFDTGASGACEVIEATTHGTSPDLKIKCYVEGVGDRYIELHA